MAFWTPWINASPEAAPTAPPIKLKFWAPTVTLKPSNFPSAIKTESFWFVLSLACFNLVEYFGNLRGSSSGSGVFKIWNSLPKNFIKCLV